MLLMEAIVRVDELKPNEYSVAEKVRWLSELDGRIVAETVKSGTFSDTGLQTAYETWKASVHLTSEGAYKPDHTEDKLWVPFPYDSVYIPWLMSKIDYANGEFGKYNNDVIQFNEEYRAYVTWMRRTYESRESRIRYGGTRKSTEWSPLDL